MRDTGPLKTALRWSGDEAFCWSYFLSGPNSLWHIGTYLVY